VDQTAAKTAAVPAAAPARGAGDVLPNTPEALEGRHVSICRAIDGRTTTFVGTIRRAGYFDSHGGMIGPDDLWLGLEARRRQPHEPAPAGQRSRDHAGGVPPHGRHPPGEEGLSDVANAVVQGVFVTFWVSGSGVTLWMCARARREEDSEVPGLGLRGIVWALGVLLLAWPVVLAGVMVDRGVVNECRSHREEEG
jgi:hypothetical protein